MTEMADFRCPVCGAVLSAAADDPAYEIEPPLCFGHQPAVRMELAATEDKP